MITIAPMSKQSEVVLHMCNVRGKTIHNGNAVHATHWALPHIHRNLIINWPNQSSSSYMESKKKALTPTPTPTPKWGEGQTLSTKLPHNREQMKL
jgi:hypothetical protein